jgi:hypothetical protein
MFFFFQNGAAQPLHQRDAYSHLLFHLFNKEWRKALQQSYKLKPPNTSVKAPPS